MAIWLVVKVLDVSYAPLGGATVQASFDGGGAFQKLAPAPDKGVFEVALPAGASRVVVRAGAPGLWSAEQKLLVSPGTPPGARFDGPQAVNVRNVDVHTRGADHAVELFFALGQLRDCAELVRDIADAEGILLAPPALTINRFQTPLLDPAATGMATLRVAKKQVAPQGKLLFAERQSVPNLLAIYFPGWQKVPPNPHRVPIPYHVVFHPFVPGTWSDEYPFSGEYVNLVSRYCVQSPSGGGKGFIHQNVADFEKVVLVFPVGKKKETVGDLRTQAGMHRLLQEVNYWVQRMWGTRWPQQPVGRSAFSAFSGGTQFLVDMVQGPRVNGFWTKTLRHIYLFDGVIQGKGKAAKTAAFAQVVKGWMGDGTRGRTARIYTQFGEWQAFADVIGGARAKGPHGAWEQHSDRGTLAFLPATYWSSLDPTWDANFAHQIFPNLFMEHAVSSSSFNV